MRRIALFVVAAMMASTGALAQERGRGAPPAPPPALEPGASQADVDKALLAAPAPLKDQATVIKWTAPANPGAADWTYVTLRKGTNRTVCFDKSGFPGQQPFSIECTSVANIPRVAQNMRFESETDRTKRQAALAAADKSGTRAQPEFGSIWWHLQGPSQAMARPHFTIAVPNATAASLGMPDNGRQGGVWIMGAGTSAAHLMIPGE